MPGALWSRIRRTDVHRLYQEDNQQPRFSYDGRRQNSNKYKEVAQPTLFYEVSSNISSIDIFKMVAFSSLIVALSAAAGVFAAPVEESTRQGFSLAPRGGTPSSTGTHNGFYYSWWTDGQAQATYTNGAAGQYSVQWSGNGNLVGGKGWNPGSNTRSEIPDLDVRYGY